MLIALLMSVSLPQITTEMFALRLDGFGRVTHFVDARSGRNIAAGAQPLVRGNPPGSDDPVGFSSSESGGGMLLTYAFTGGRSITLSAAPRPHWIELQIVEVKGVFNAKDGLIVNWLPARVQTPTGLNAYMRLTGGLAAGVVPDGAEFNTQWVNNSLGLVLLKDHPAPGFSWVGQRWGLYLCNENEAQSRLEAISKAFDLPFASARMHPMNRDNYLFLRSTQQLNLQQDIERTVALCKRHNIGTLMLNYEVGWNRGSDNRIKPNTIAYVRGLRAAGLNVVAHTLLTAYLPGSRWHGDAQAVSYPGGAAQKTYQFSGDLDRRIAIEFAQDYVAAGFNGLYLDGTEVTEKGMNHTPTIEYAVQRLYLAVAREIAQRGGEIQVVQTATGMTPLTGVVIGRHGAIDWYADSAFQTNLQRVVSRQPERVARRLVADTGWFWLKYPGQERWVTQGELDTWLRITKDMHGVFGLTATLEEIEQCPLDLRGLR